MRSFLLGALCGAAMAGVIAFGAWPPQPLPTSQVPGSSVANANAQLPSLAASETSFPQRRLPLDAQASTPSAKPQPVQPTLLPLVAQAALPRSDLPTIVLSAEHAALLMPNGAPVRPTLPQLHGELSGQSKDPAWADPLEQAIRQSINSANGAGEFEILNVDCRTTLCEILAFGNLPTSGEHWNSILSSGKDQPWYDGIMGNTTIFTTKNNRYTIVTILQRKL